MCGGAQLPQGRSARLPPENGAHKTLKHSAIILYVAWQEDLDQEPKKLSRGFLRQTRGTYVLMGQNLTYECRRFQCGINSIAKSARRAAMHPFRAAVRLSTRFLSKRNILTSDETASFQFSLFNEKTQPLASTTTHPSAGSTGTFGGLFNFHLRAI